MVRFKSSTQNGWKIYNPFKLPSVLNNFFVSVGKNYAEKIPQSKIEPVEYLQDINQLSSFFFIPVIAAEIESEILLLPSTKAYGLYSWPVNLLKTAKHILSEHLAKLMSLSIQTGKYPTRLKISKIIPVYKSDDETDPTVINQFLSFLFSIFRVFEKKMYDKLIKFLEKHQLLSHIQYGFRKNHSPITLFSTLLIQYKLTWITNHLHVQFLLI